ncbi:MAG: BrnT family toxin [Desulfobacteraceae bacterium]|nr:MAG: BrnT family toxin [Desulfobacteraceae bacterium]
MMNFEWDDQKSDSNKLKHGIDFNDATALWIDPFRVEIKASFQDEDRFVLIGMMDDKIWTAIFTIRNQAVRIISVRRAREKEALLYDEK